MGFALRSFFSPEWRVDEIDAENIAASPNRLGYYEPDPRTGIVPFDPDHQLLTALRKF
ncbi:MAG: hypothetical protein ACT4OY_01165 [Alphaproteobacteria bacterium]